MKLPFGIAQLGKAFRNEITTGNFLFRTREFEQMEMEFFIDPKDAKEQLEYWSQERLNWFKKLGVRKDKLRLRPHATDELAHYSTACYDIEYEFPFGWSELEGIADRGTYEFGVSRDFEGVFYESPIPVLRTNFKVGNQLATFNLLLVGEAKFGLPEFTHGADGSRVKLSACLHLTIKAFVIG